MGIGYYDQGISVDRAMRARAVQQFMMTRVSGSSYDLPPDLSVNLLARAKSLRNYGVGRLGSGRIGHEHQPWYEAFFEHIETIAPVAAQLVLNIMQMRGQQRQQYWQQQNAQQRQAAYLTMMNQQVTGQGEMDADTMAFLSQQLANDPNRNQVFLNAAGGNQSVANRLSAAMGFTVWYQNPLVLLGIGAGVLAFGTLIIVTVMKD